MSAVRIKKKIALVAGGDSGEKVISIASAGVVRKHLDPAKYEVYTIHLSREGWFYIPEKGKPVPIDKNDFSLRLGTKKITFDCVFMAIHGTPGEDGRLQAYFDMIGLPYTNCGQLTSALTFNKGYCNKMVAACGARVSKSIHLLSRQSYSAGTIEKELKFPLFVKPNNGGSSIGMSKVDRAEDLPSALKKAFREDREVLVEEYIKGMEITCGVFKHKGSLTVFPITQIVPKTAYFDYEAKYQGKSEEITPAPISEEAEIECKMTSAMLYEKLNCKGVVRFDYILSKKGLYFLEVNTVPGMSEASIVPQQVQVLGWTIRKFFGMMIENALYSVKH